MVADGHQPPCIRWQNLRRQEKLAVNQISEVQPAVRQVGQSFRFVPDNLHQYAYTEIEPRSILSVYAK